MRLSGKTVLITGASKGIGRALALGCAHEGADIILNYNSDRDGGGDARVDDRAGAAAPDASHPAASAGLSAADSNGVRGPTDR
jgi:NAD(P)-dependent dehydrogenase (short-subunit alcohol dehydrogenase family)